MNWALLLNSLCVSGVATIASVAGGGMAALWCAGLEARWRTVFLVAAVIAMVFPPFLVVNCWMELLGETGRWRQWLPVNIYTPGGTVWVLTLLTWPIAFLFVSASWRRIQTEHLEADPMLGGTSLMRFLLLPLARASIVQAAVLTFVLTLNNFAVPALLQVKVFPAEVWVRFNTTFEYKSAMEISWPMMLAPLLLVLFFRRREISWSWRSSTASSLALRRQLGPGWHGAAGVVALLLAGFSLGVPIYQLAGSASTWREFYPALEAGKLALAHSFGYAAVSATVVILFALLTWRMRLDSILWIPFFIPGVLLGIAIIWIFNRPGLSAIYQSSAIVILAFGLRYMALGWNGVARAFRSSDQSLSDVGKLEGASCWQLLRHVYWPQISPRLAAAWYVTYLLCLWDVETLVLIVPPGGESMALRIFNLLHYGHNSQVNALCLLLLVLALVPLLFWAGIELIRNRRAAALAGAVMILTGCTAEQKTEASVQSKLFSAVQIIGSRGTGVGELNKPRSVAVDSKDNLFVVDMTGRVQKFSPDGVYLAGWQMPEVAKGKPKGMCRDKAGDIVVVEPHYSRVNHYSPDCKLVAQWGVHGTNFGELGMPRGAAINSRGEIYVCEYTLSERVQWFSPHGEKCLGAFGKLGDGQGEFSRAEGIAIDAQDRVYVADSCNHRVQVFTADGKFLRAYGKAGSGTGELSYPYDIQVDAAGRQYVCEFGNSRIQIFDANDRPIETLGGPGGAPGEFSNPWSIALDSKGNLYVADSMNHRVEKFLRAKTG